MAGRVNGLSCPAQASGSDAVLGQRRAEATPSLATRLFRGDLLGLGVGRAVIGLFRRCTAERRLGMPDMRETLPLGGLVISAGVIMHGAVVVAVGSAVGAGEIFHRISEIGVGIAQSLGGAGVAEAAGGGELDLHQPDGAAASDQSWAGTAF